MVGREPVRGGPVRGRRPAREQPRGGQQVRADAHRGDAAGVPGGLGDPADQVRIDHRRAVAVHRARHHQGVDPVADLPERQVGDEPDAGGGAHLAAVRPGEQHPVGRPAGHLPVREREHLRGPGDVEQVDVREHGDNDTVRCGHEPIVTGMPPCPPRRGSVTSGHRPPPRRAGATPVSTPSMTGIRDNDHP
ncbi:hypothetical protein GCM10009727_26900 [Actinomadura napierensis]|uniref:Uncharacterized protein n=1 Tax=Actinomadura napierensis TaxID=267854 RepID=A0ABP5KN74_9ACTN